MAVGAASVTSVCEAARIAGSALADAGAHARSAALERLAQELDANRDWLLDTNGDDLDDARASGATPASLEALRLTGERAARMVASATELAAAPDPVGAELAAWRTPDGARVRKLRVPLGVVALVLEGRPHLLADTAACCIRSGNALVVHGSADAMRSYRAVTEIAARALAASGLPPTVFLLDDPGEDALEQLTMQRDTVGLVKQRGHNERAAAIMRRGEVPSICAIGGNCHLYVDRAADLALARDLLVDSKLSRPGMCGAAETLLVHAAVAERFLSEALALLHERGVELRADERTRRACPRPWLAHATDDDWAREYLGLVLAVALVDSAAAAIEHVNRYGSGHSEAIVTDSLAAADAFTRGVDAACVGVNVSTRAVEGPRLGLGRDIGNSTQKLPVRGAVGPAELCTTKHVVVAAT